MFLKNLFKEYSGKFLKLVKQKSMYPYEHMGSFEKFLEDTLPDVCEFFSSLVLSVKKIILKLLMFGMFSNEYNG